MNGSQSDTDLLLRIRDRAGPDKAYPVEALLSDGSFFRGELPLDLVELKTADNNHDISGYGQHLYERLFTGWISQAYDLARGIARERSDGQLHVRLWIDSEEPELQALKWERLYHYHNEQFLPLTVCADTAFSRYTGLGIAESQPIARRPLQMLVAISNPSDLISRSDELAPVKVNEEVVSLLDVLGTLPERQQIHLTLMLGHTGESELTDAVRARLRDCYCTVYAEATSLDRIGRLLARADIFHFIGHGQFSKRRQRSALLLEDEDGHGEWVDDQALISTLAASVRLPHLIFLASCESARRADNRPYVGLAASLVRAGVPAVVAMQDTVTMPGAKQLARDFYEQLLQDGVVDRALNTARGRLYNDHPGMEGDWSTPVLFMRLRTGRLFAPDPVRATMEAMAADPAFSFFDPESGHYLPLPVEVVSFQEPRQLRRFGRLDPEMTGALDFGQAIGELLHREREEVPAETGEEKPLVVGVVGGLGSNKGTQLKGLVWRTLQAGLDPEATTTARALPVWVDLRDYTPELSNLYNSLEARVLEALGQFWPDLDAKRLSEIPTEPHLRLVFHGIDLLSPANSTHTQAQLRSLLQAYPQHVYIIAADERAVDWRALQAYSSLHLLVLQPLRRVKVRHFLENLEEISALRELTKTERAALGRQLVARLYRSQLFDLVATPWFMVQVLLRATAGDLPSSRTDALQKLVEDAVAELPAEKGMRSHAGATLCELAWEMQRKQLTALSIETVFATMAEVRGNRGYSLETFYTGLLEHDLLQATGEDAISFAYEPFQAYYCARAIVQSAERQQILDDIIVRLGTPAALHWWEDTLVLVTGLLAQARKKEALNRLLHTLSEGLDLLQGEALFLVARCLMECEPQAGERGEEMGALRQQVVRALHWRTDSRNEPELRLRVLATQLLSRVAEPEVIIHLAKLVYEQVRTSLSDEKDFEFSSVRMAGAIGLQRIEPPEKVYDILETQFHPSLKSLFSAWKESDLHGLKEAFTGAVNPGAQAVAALAIGDVAEQLWAGASHDEGHEALAFLASAFREPQTVQAVRWALADALAMMDALTVSNEVVIPYLAEVAQRQDEADDWLGRDKCVAYLIGLIRAQGPEVLAFLTETCIGSSSDVRLWLCAMEALARLGGAEPREWLAKIATGGAWLEQTFADAEKRNTLRQKAISLLVEIGDRETIAALRASPAADERLLLPSIYQATRSVYWQDQG